MKGQGNQGMFGSFNSQSAYKYFTGNGDCNTWGQQVNADQRKKQQYGDFYTKENRGNLNHSHNDAKSLEGAMYGMGIESGEGTRERVGHAQNVSGSNKSETKETGPKKMTWASVASQPAKPQIRASSSSLTLKKKGMAPPPMVPGKHNMDIGTWDAPARHYSASPVAPSPPPSVMSESQSQTQKPVTNESPPLGSGPPKANNNAIAEHIIQQQLPKQQQQQQQQQNHHQQSQRHQRSHQSIQSPASIVEQHSGNSHQYQNNLHSSGGNDIISRSSWNTQTNRQQHNNMMTSHAQHHHNQQRSNEGSKVYQQQPHSQIQSPQHYHGGNNRSQQQSQALTATVIKRATSPNNAGSSMVVPSTEGVSDSAKGGVVSPAAVLKELKVKNNYNPPEFDFERAALARFFVIKSYSEDDIHRSIKYEIWCSTEHGNKRLDQAYRERENVGGVIFLFFSVNGSGHFCGMAQMSSSVDYNSNSSVWAQDKWKGSFRVKWIYVKDVPNTQLRYIHLENNENKPVTNSRDTQEVPNAKGLQVLKIMHAFKHSTSIFDDFGHYELKQKADNHKDTPTTSPFEGAGSGSVGTAVQTVPSFNKMIQNPFEKPSQQNDRAPHRSGGLSQDNFDNKTFKLYGRGGSNSFHSSNQSPQIYGGGYSNGSGNSSGGFDRPSRNHDYHQVDGGGGNYVNIARDGRDGQNDFHRNNRNEFRLDFRRNDRTNINGDTSGNYNIRDHEGLQFSGRSGVDRGGNHRDHYRDRVDHQSGRGRGRGGGSYRN